MPRLAPSAVPSYRLHKQSGQAVVTLNGKDVLLGKHDTPESRQEYDRIVAEWIAAGRQWKSAAADLTVAELVARFWAHVTTRYVDPEGNPTGEQDNFKHALSPLLHLYAKQPAAKFGPLSLKAVREEMIKRGWCRNVVNRSVNRVRQFFKWCTSNELIPASVHHGLTAVDGLRQGMPNVKESAPVKPVPDPILEAVLPKLPRILRAMADLQTITGMRPTEVCTMRTGDIDRTGTTWEYRPRRHKTQHHGHERVVHLGKRCKEILADFLKLDPDAYLFSPAQAERERREKLAAERAADGTPLSCGNVPGSNRKRKPAKAAGDHYTKDSYTRALQAVCDQTFPPPPELERQRVPGHGRKAKSTRWETDKELRARLGEAKWAELKAWRKAHAFAANRLRHNAGTRFRRDYGLEAASVLLGHRSMVVTETYAEQDASAARRIMGEVG